MLIKKLIRRYRRWKNWSRYTTMNKFNRILVLLYLKHGPGFDDTAYFDNTSIWDY